MRFFRAVYKTNKFAINPAETDSRLETRALRDSMRSNMRLAVSETNEGDGVKCYAFVYEMTDITVRIAAVCFGNADPNEKINKLASVLKIESGPSKVEEITFRVFDDALAMAQRSCLIDYDCNDDFYDEFGINDISRPRCMVEEVFKLRSDEEIKGLFGKITTSKSFEVEYNRIKKNESTRFFGHPVHYFIETDDQEVRFETYQMLLSSLYNAGRLTSKRYYYVDYSTFERHDVISVLSEVYDSVDGGTVMVRFHKDDLENESNRAGELRRCIEAISSLVQTYRNKVLTVICLPKASDKIRGIFEEYLSTMSFVTIKDELLSDEDAKKFLENFCAESGVECDDGLLSRVKEGELYDSVNLKTMYDAWYDVKLKNNFYPSYGEIETITAVSGEKKPEGDSFAELDEMIGLASAKELIKKAVDSFKAQELFGERGLARDDFSRHMIFTGNPGTAKTTAARLFAHILRDNGILSRGQLIEVGRGDLVGKYVGWTADIVKKKFKEARGGVLFVDEAYSLVDDRDGLYGDEAINTIVQEMENHRDDVIVIFAGYPDKMEGFLKKNPGLRSRIAFHVRFEDYDVKELCEIASLMAKRKGVTIEKEGMEKLETIFSHACKNPDFGNGRFVRNVIEHALMAQASRLVNMPVEDVNMTEITTIRAKDIEEPDIGFAPCRKSIGFCA